MKDIEEIKAVLREHKAALREKYNVDEIGVFGSFLRGEQRKNSDVDILVDFSESIDLFSYVQLRDYLSTVLGVKVDLVMKDTLKPRLKESILSEAVYP